jgi:hypothetical protein
VVVVLDLRCIAVLGGAPRLALDAVDLPTLRLGFGLRLGGGGPR